MLAFENYFKLIFIFVIYWYCKSLGGSLFVRTKILCRLSYYLLHRCLFLALELAFCLKAKEMQAPLVCEDCNLHTFSFICCCRHSLHLGSNLLHKVLCKYYLIQSRLNNRFWYSSRFLIGLLRLIGLLPFFI